MKSTTPSRRTCPVPAKTRFSLIGGVARLLALTFSLLILVTGCREPQGISDASIDLQPPPSVDTSLTCPSLALQPDGDVWGLSWTAPHGALTYSLEEDRDPNFSSAREVYRGPLTSVRTGIPAGVQQWYFRVRAINRTATSPWSNIVGAVSGPTGFHTRGGTVPG